MRNLIYLLLLLIAILTVSLSVSIMEAEKAKQENTRLTQNLNQYGNAISTLTLTNSEIETELQKKNSALIEADSILNEKNIKISQLEKLVKTRIIIHDRDTTYIFLKPEVLPLQMDTTYKPKKFNFSDSKSCIKFSGFITSDDPKTKLAITERSADIKVYDIRIHRRWWQFWRPKEERLIETNCGDVEIETIYRKK
jgi:NACalpha-BTF3-like transcription factor